MIPVALSSGALSLLAVLFTYLLHSTVFVLAIWAITRLALRRQPGAANRLWRLALVAPLLSTAVALSLPDGWRIGRLDLRAPVVEHRPLTPTVAPLAPLARGEGELEAAVAEEAPLEADQRAAPGVLPQPAPLWQRWPVVVLGLLGILGIGRLSLLGARIYLFRRGLRGRRVVTDGRVVERLQGLCERSGNAPAARAPRLTVCPKVLVPMALGGQEICLPEQALDGLADAELDAVLAHELAHLERADNGWLALASALEAVLFFQPLTPVIRRRLQETAELACDERAVELTGSARALARSLAEVAAWNLGGDLAVPVSAMAHRSGLLLRRVETLLSEGATLRKRLRPATVRLLVAGVFALGLAIPGVGLGLDGQDRAAVAAPGRVTVDPPKATAAANRFSPPVTEPDRDYRPGRAAATTAGAAPAGPTFPMPPLPPPSFMEPMGSLLGGVMNGIVPQALSAAGKLGPLAGRQASLEIRRDLLRDRKQRGPLSAEDERQLAEVERELPRVKAQLKEAEKRLEAEMEVAGKEFERTHGKEFEQKMERWGEEYGKAMEKWGEQFGKEMEKWGEQYGKDMEKWAEHFAKGMEGRKPNPAGTRPKTEAPADKPSPSPVAP